MTPLDVFKAVGGPGSIGLLAVLCAVGLFVIYVWPKHRAAGRAWLLSVYVAHVLAGLPVIANSVAAPFDAYRPLDTTTALKGTDTVLVFGGDNAVGRVQETLRLWRNLKPTSIVVSGEDWFVERLVEAGIPSSRVAQDRVSATTREQITYLRSYLVAHPSASVVVVASRLQMPRVAALLHAEDVQVALAPSPVDREPPRAGAWVFVPTYAGLRVTRDALYERVALVYYEWRGWIAPQAATLSAAGGAR